MPDINALRTRFQAYDDEYNSDRARTIAMGGQPIDRSRPIFNNSDGSFSTERTAGFEMDGKYYVIPTIVNGQQLSPDEAMKATIRGENKPVGVFNSQAEGDAYAKSRSNEIGQVRGGEAQSKSGMQSVFLQDKNERLWFPADMKDDEIQKIIERDIYGNKSASDILGDFFKGPKEVLKRAGTEIAQGVGDIASAGAGLSREAQRGVPVIDERLQKVASQENALMGARANMLGKDAPVPAVPPDAAERRAPIMQQQAESYGQTAQALDQFTQGLPKTAEPFYGEDKPVKRFIEDAITGIVRFAPSMVTSAVSPPVGLASTYAQYFGNSYRAKKDKGVKDEVAYSAAMMDTMIGAPMEFGGNIFQIGKFKRSLDAFTKAGKLTGKAAEVFKNIINGALGEGLEEYFQQYPQELGDIYAANADKPAGEISKIVLGTYASKKFQKEALYSAAVGAAGGAALGAVGGAGGLARKGAQLDERGEVGTPSSPGPTIQPPSLADRVAADVAEGRITPEQLKQERANLDDNNPVAQAIDAFFGTQKQQPESRYPGYQDDFRQAEPSPQSVSRTPAERQRLINREMGYEAPPQEPVVPLSELNQRKINNLWDKYEQGAAEGAYESKKDLINEIRTDTREAGELIPNPEIKRLADRIWNMSRRAERNPEIDRLRQRVEGIPQRAAEARTLQWEEVLRTSPVNLEGVNPYASRAGERPESTSRQEGPNLEGQGPVHLRDTQENRLETGAREERPAAPEQAQPEPEKRPEITLSSTPDAIAFGEKATPEQVSELKRLRKESIAESERLMKTDIQAASDAAAQGQFYREAIEASEGRHPSQKKAETTKLLPPPTQSAFEETPLPTTYLQERGDKALSEGELISPRSPEFKRLRENMATVGEEALAAYRKVYPRGPVVLSQPSMKKYRGQNNGVIIATSTKEPGKFQVTRWDDRGFSGDHQVKTEVDAVKEAYLEGYRIPARQRFETISKTGRFHEGLSKTEQIQREHQSRMAELDKKTEQPPAQVQEPETRPADKIKSAYDALKAERGISNIEIADVRDRAGVSQKDMEDFAKQNKNTILSLGDASVVNAHVKSGGVKVSWDARPHLLMRMGADEATKSKPVEPEPRKQATERAWVNGQWRPIIEKKEYKRGKNKGKFRVALANGKTKVVDADGIRGIEQREPTKPRPAPEPPKEEQPKAPTKSENMEPVAPKKAQEKEPEIKITSTAAGVDVKVDIPKSEEKALSPKEQKQYLIDEIDEAIKQAQEDYKATGLPSNPYEWNSIYEENGAKTDAEKIAVQQQVTHDALNKVGSIRIHIPGDGDFNVINSKQALRQFKKMANAFPATENLTGPKLFATPGVKPSGKRLRDFAGHYYNEFKPRKIGIVEREADGGPAGKPGQYYNGGYFSDGGYIIALKARPKTKHPVATAINPSEASGEWGAPDLKKVVADDFEKRSEQKPAQIVGEFYQNEDFEKSLNNPLAHVKQGKNNIIIQAHYADSIITEYPKATITAGKESDPVIFHQNGKIVGVVMPMRTEGVGYPEAISKHFKAQKTEKVSPKTTGDRSGVEAMPAELELKGERVGAKEVLRAKEMMGDAAHDGERSVTIPDEKELVLSKEVHDWERGHYVKDGGTFASSRNKPMEKYPWVDGTWKIDDHFGIYGRMVEQIRRVPLSDLSLSEEDYTKVNFEGRGFDAEQYAKWMKEGRTPPPVLVVETDTGVILVSDGHRRVAAAKMAGADSILAWVSPRMDTGKKDTSGKPIYTAATYEGMKYGVKRASEMYDKRQAKAMGQVSTEVVNKRLEDEKPNQRTYREFAKAAVIPYAKIDWGRQPRGQGKRAGGMVMGGMSNAPTGVKSYPDFENAEGVTPEAWEEIKLLEDEDKRAAIGALQNGKTFDEAMRMVYAEQDRIKKQPEKIEDFGEKLGGARKDMQPSISREISDDEIATKSFSEIWPKSDVDAIEDNDLAAVAHAVRSEVPAKPRKGYKVARWVEQVKTVRGLMRHAQENGVAAILKKMDESGETLQSFASKIRLLQKIDREQWDRVGSVKYYPKAQSYEGGKLVYSPYAIAEIDNSTVDAKSFDDLVAAVHGKLAVEQAGGTMQFEIRSKRDGSLTFINKKGDPLYRPLKTFKDVKEAREFMRRGKSELVKAWEDLKERENVKETDVRRVENRPRTGKDHRNGKDATPEMFMSAFGFRGVEFGNWVSQGKNAKERQGILNQAYDALMDLSDIIGVPPKALSLNGSLGLGLGSRGHGWASAHFEPDSLVINLTKTRGAGALAHELFHAFDNYFQLKRGKSKTRSREGNYITYQPETYYENTKTGHRLSARRFEEIKYKNGITTPEDWKRIEGVRPEVEEAFADLVKALDASPMNKRSNLIDKGKSGGYWSRVIERAARAFENYINFKMQQNGYQNDYLANVTPASEFARDAGRYPYLLDEEIKPVAEAFDNLFATIKTKETDKGVAMFDRGGRRPAGLTKESIQSATQFATRRWNNGPSIGVVQHQHELPTGILSYLKKVGADQDIVRGVFHKDRVYIVADNFTGMPDVFRTLVHESFGHYGIRRMLGPQWPGIMENIYRSHKDAVQAVAKEYGFDTSTEKGRGYAAEEWLSREAETNPKAPIVERVVAAIRRVLRRLGLDMKFTDAEVRDLLVRSREYVQTGRPANIIKAFSNAAFNKHGREQIWYSQMERVLAQKLPGKGNPKAIAGVLDSWARKGEFKQEELEWSGIKEWLDAHPNSIVTKNEVMEWLAANNVHVQEVIKGTAGKDWPPPEVHDINRKMAELERERNAFPDVELRTPEQHKRVSQIDSESEDLYSRIEYLREKHSYPNQPVYDRPELNLPGGENYRELLLTLPEKNPFEVVPHPKGAGFAIKKSDGSYIVAEEGTLQPGAVKMWDSRSDAEKYGIPAWDTESFRSTHYQEPNILAHVRFNERWTSADGTSYTPPLKTLFIEEVQSDWAQKGRKEGFNLSTHDKPPVGSTVIEKRIDGRWQWAVEQPDGNMWIPNKEDGTLTSYGFASKESAEKAITEGIKRHQIEGVPDAPFVKDTGKWSMLAMKRMVRYAAENGFDRVAWTRGEQQVERYKEALRSVVDEVRWTKTDNGVQLVGFKNGKQVVDTVEKENVVSDAIGKSMGDSILQSPEQSGVFKGDEITISDTGMAGFYDKILPAEVNKFFGKAAWGNARVGETKLNTAIDQHMKELAWLSADAKTDSPYIKTVHSLDITPQMREKAMGGMPLFSKKKPMTYAEQLMAQPEAKQMQKDLATPPDTRGMLKDVRGWAKERFGKGYVDSDMKRLNKVLETPYGLAKKFPSMKAAMETELNAAEKRSKILFHDYNDSGLQAVQEHMQKNKAHLKEMTDLVWKWDGKRFPRSAVPTDALSYPADITEDITINPAHYDEAHAYLIKKGVTPEVADAFVTLRKLYDKKFVEIDKTMRVEDLDAELITQYRGEIGKINNYFPHRRSGDSYVQWIDKSKAGTDEAIVYREHYYSAIDRMRPVNDKAKSRAATWLQAAIARGEVSGTVEDYQLKQGPVKQMPDEVFFQIPVEGMQQVADAAGRELEKSRVMYEAERLFKKGEVASMADGIELAQKRLRKDMSAALSKAIAEVFKPRGWARSAMPRKGIPGHETSDVFGITLDYLSGFAGFKTKIERARAHSGILHSINAKARPEEYRYVSNYIKDMLANQDKTDRAVDTVRGLFFLKYLGFVFKSGIVNLTQNAVMAAPRLSIETKHANTRLAKAMFDVRRALASKEAVAGKEITYANLNANERRMLHEMTEQGVSIDQFLRELKGSIPGKNIYSQALRNFADKSGIFMQLAERFNRASTALAAYRVAVNEKGMDHDKAVDFAKGIVYDSHFVYGKHNLPMWARGGQMRKYLRSAYTFRSFTHNYLNMIHYMALHQGTQGKLAVARSLRNTIAMGGLASFPFIKLLGDAVMWALGRDDEDALTAVREQVPDYLRDVLTYGLPGVAGVDISGSLSLDMPKQWYEILGVPYAAYQDTLNMVESYKSGQTMRSVAESPITPMMVRNAMRGLDLYLYGQHTRSGRALNAPGQVGPRKIDEADLVKKVALGFQPVEISKGYAQYQAVDKAVKLADEKKRYLSNRYVNAMNRNDEAEQRAVIEEVLKWNEEKIAEGKPHLIIDPRQSIRARLAQQPLQRIPMAQRGNALATAGAWQ